MLNKEKKIVLLSVVTLFLFLGTGIFIPGVSVILQQEDHGDIPSSTPKSSRIDTWSGSDGANIGVYGYSNGTKEGSYDFSDWYHEASQRGAYYRTPNIAFPVPDSTTAPWTVKGISANVSNVLDNKDFIDDGQFDKGEWSPVTTSLSIGGNSLISNAGIGTISAPGNSYFDGRNGMHFDVGSNRQTTTTTFTGSDVTSGSYSSTGVTYNQYSKHSYYDSANGQTTNDFAQLNWACFGYRDQYQSGVQWWDDANFAHNGGTVPDMSGYTEYGGAFTPDTINNKITAYAHLWTYATIGSRAKAESSTKQTTRAYATTQWNDYVNWDYWAEKPINWVDDGSDPQHATVTYSIQRDPNHVPSSDTFYDSGQPDASKRNRGGGATVTAYLKDPLGARIASDTPRKFGNGYYGYDSSHGWITDTNTHPYTWDITAYLKSTGETNPYKLGFDVYIDLHNYGNYQDIQGPDTYGPGYSAVAVELQQKNAVGVIISNIQVTVNDERKWDNGNTYNYVYYKHNDIDFGGRVVPDNVNPTLTFDWYIPSGIQGYNTEHGDPVTGLEWAQPIAYIHYYKPGTGWDDYFFIDSENFRGIRNRTVAESGYSWLGQPNEWGADHFSVEWTNGHFELDGVTTIQIYVGFRFNKNFITDWNVASSSNRTIAITNVTFAFESEPYPDDIGMQLVWDMDGSGSSSNYKTSNVIGTSGGIGYVNSMPNLELYTDPLYPGRMFYWRINEESRACRMNWKITLIIEYEYWGYTTQWEITSTGNAQFNASFTMDVPSENGFLYDYKDNFWFDVLFPRYQIVANGEPYWDLDVAYETSNPQVWSEVDALENLTQALSSKGSKIAVYENDTDGNRYSAALGSLLEYHQFARFHKELLSQWSTQQHLNWLLEFNAPNYVSNIELSSDNFAHTSSTFHTGTYCQVKGTYITTMQDVYTTNPRGDIGEAHIYWYSPANGVLTGSPGNPTNFTSSEINGNSSNNVTNAYLINNEYPGGGYSATFQYIDRNPCGDSNSNGISGGYSSGVFRLGYKTAEFTVMRSSSVDSIVIDLPINTTSNIPSLDTSVEHRNFSIMVTWKDENGTGIAGANAHITISGWMMADNGVDKKSITVPLSNYTGPEAPKNSWDHIPMKDLNNGSYIVWCNPYYKYHQGNMTWGFHNFTITLERTGYDVQNVQGNFSIMVDTILTITNPAHSDTEPGGITTPARPQFDGDNCFATKPYTVTANLRYNTTEDKYFYNETGSFYYPYIRYRYQLIGYYDASTNQIEPYTTPGFINWTWFNSVYGNSSNTFVNGSFSKTTGWDFGANLTWPSFSDMEDKGVPKYVPDVHVYYNLTAYVITNRTYDPNNTQIYQPNDVKIQTLEDNPYDSINPNQDQKYAVEEMFGFAIHRENTDNVTFMSLMNNEALDGKPFAMGKFDPDFDHEGSFEDYEIDNYWYNATSYRFRLRVRLNCTQGAGTLGPSKLAPPVGPLNESTVLYGENYSDWMGETKIVLKNWNSTTINFTADSSTFWSCMVNTSTANPFRAWGQTYVTPWLYFNQTNAGSRVLEIESNKKGFTRDRVFVRLNIWEQTTAVYNDTDPSEQFTTQIYHGAHVTTGTGISTSLIIRYNDTTNPGISRGIENAEIDCIDDDWADHYRLGEGITWNWTELGGGRYNISIIDTALNVLTPTNKTMQIKIFKGNYSEAVFNIIITIVPRHMQIQLLHGKVQGPTTPVFLKNNFTDLAHINLTYAIYDLDNNSATIDFSQYEIDNNFRFRQGDGIHDWTAYVHKFYNSSGVFYKVIIDTYLDTPLDVLAGEYWRQMAVNFSITGVVNYYPTSNKINVNITAINTSIQLRTSATVDVEYLLNNTKLNWLEHCPSFEMNFTDIIHNSYVGRNLPIDVDGITLISNYTNPNRNGADAVNPNSLSNEDIFLQTMNGIDGWNEGYEYLKIVVDTRGIDVQNNIHFRITLKKENYFNASIDLTINILNASTNIKDNIINIGVMNIDHVPDWQSQEIIDKFSAYSNTNGLNEKVVPWGFLMAIKCSYESQGEILSSDADGTIYQSISNLPSELTPNFYEESKQLYYYFWATLQQEGTYNNNMTIWLWKHNFQPASYIINYTIRPRKTEVKNLTSLAVSASWREIATFQIRYWDSDALEGIDYSQINGTQAKADGPIFTFSNNLSASWQFTELPNGEYVISINTSNLKARDEPFIFNFEILKRGADNLVHWTPQTFTVNLTVKPVEIHVDYYFAPGDTDPNLNTPAQGVGLIIDPDEYSYFNIFLRVYIILNGERYYITNESELQVTMIIYNWNGNWSGITNESNQITKVEFTFKEMEAYSASFKGFWTATVKLDFFNPQSLVNQHFPREVHLDRYNQMVFNITSNNPNFNSASGEFGLLIIRAIGAVPWFVYLITFIEIGAAIGAGGYAFKKALALRIPYVLRKIDETIDKISKDKFPQVGVMRGREEFIINLVIEYLDMCGIEWETTEKYEIESTRAEEEEEGLPPLTHEELTVELNKIESLTPDERMLFIDELKQLDRKAQIEFLKSLKEESEE